MGCFRPPVKIQGAFLEMETLGVEIKAWRGCFCFGVGLWNFSCGGHQAHPLLGSVGWALMYQLPCRGKA